MSDAIPVDEAGSPDLGAVDPVAPRPRRVGRTIISGLITYGVVALALWFLYSKLSEETDLASALGAITVAQVVVICILGVINLATNLPPIVVALPGLRLREAAVTNTASAALSNTVPEGGAVATGLNYAMLRSWGFRLDDITSEVIVTGTWSQVTKFSLLALSMAAVAVIGPAPDWLAEAALVMSVLVIAAIIVLALILRSERFARRLGRWLDGLVRLVRRMFKSLTVPSMEEAVPIFRTEMVGLLRLCWGRLTVAMIVSQLTACFVLGVACRMQGLDDGVISWATIILAYSACILASLLVPTPGGLGVAEIVLVTVLGFGLPDSYQGPVVAAVVLYRIATFLVPIPIGLCTYIYWRKSKTWRRPVNSRPVHPELQPAPA